MPTDADKLQPRDTPIAAGETAPDFTLMTQNKADWTLSAHLEMGDVVLCFYPMDFSPVCGTEMKCVTDDIEKWSSKNATVVGVSCDSFFVHEAWARELGLKQDLLADMHRKVCKAYGLYFPDLNVAARGTVVIAGGDSPDKGKVKWSQAREIPQAMDLNETLLALG